MRARSADTERDALCEGCDWTAACYGKLRRAFMGGRARERCVKLLPDVCILTSVKKRRSALISSVPFLQQQAHTRTLGENQRTKLQRVL